jgi:hypothetical protein
MASRICCNSDEGMLHELNCPEYHSVRRMKPLDPIRDITKEGEETKDTLGGGATRTKSPYRFDLIPANTDKRTALRFGLGAQKHGEGNWQQGDYTFVVSCVNHLRTHLNTMVIQEDNVKDDNIGAMLWNIHVIGWYEENKPAEFAKAMAYLHRGVKP